MKNYYRQSNNHLSKKKLLIAKFYLIFQLSFASNDNLMHLKVKKKTNLNIRLIIMDTLDCIFLPDFLKTHYVHVAIQSN